MAQRPWLKGDQWAVLLNAPADDERLIQHYTLGEPELELVRAKTADHNQLGLAVQLCLMRHLGRPWLHDETLPPPVIAFVAQQLDLRPEVLADYGRRDTTRREHAAEAQRYLGLRAADRSDRRAALAAGISAAAATDKGRQIAEAMIAAFRERQALLPAADTLDRTGRAARAIARRRMESALLDDLDAEQLTSLDALLEVDPTIRLTRFAWLRSPPEAPSEKHLDGLIARLNFVRSFSFESGRRDKIHPGRWNQLVREGDVTPSWLTGDFNTGRRRSLIAAQLIELNGKLTDAAVTMFCRLIARLFTSSKARQDRRHLDARKDTARLLGLFRDTIDAIATAVETGEDAFETLDREVGWHRLVQARRDVAALAASADPDPLIGATDRYGGIRRCVLALVDTLVFRSARRNDPLLAAVELLRQLRSDTRRPLPGTPPVGHLKDKVRKVIFAGGRPDRRLYEVATLAALRDRLRAGDIWVEGGRDYRPLDGQLIPRAAFAARKDAEIEILGVPRDVDTWLTDKQRELDFKLKQLSHRARTGKLPDVRLENGVLIISPARSAVPKAADPVNWLCLDRMPRIDITDLLAEVDTWTGFAGCFTHMRTGEAVRAPSALLAAILGDATNFGAKRMADASMGLTERQITWARLFHTRPETYKSALATVINAHLAHPHSKLWGAGMTSSSDGQFFRAAARGARRSDVNAHYSGDPGVKFYT